VLDVLHSDRFVDQSPAEVHATLLEEQTYRCSPRTMYRVLAQAGEVRERRDQVRHPAYAKPELVATTPNQTWSWDITKLKGPVAYLYFSLYVILDLFSRYVVGWMVAAAESARLAERLIAATCQKQGIAPHQLTIHADRGAPMRSKVVAELFVDLGSRRAIRARVSATTIPFPKRNSGRSNIGRSFRAASAPSKMRARSATTCSRGITTRITTAACDI
jgi:putative transposase